MSQPFRDAGFTLVEMLVAAAILVTVTGAVFAVMHPARGVFQTQAESSDLQQKLRVGVEAIRRELAMAGAGTYSGPAGGPLYRFLAPILPMRVGRTGADPPGTARADAITIVYVPPTAAQATIRDRAPEGMDRVTIDPAPGCPAGDALCGFAEGMRVLMFDEGGSSGVFTVTSAEAPILHLRHRDGWPATAHGASSPISQAASHTFYYDRANLQLRHDDGHQSDLPLLDHVVGLGFEYFGDPQPPVVHEAATDSQAPLTTYGPGPPDIGVDVPTDTWPAGENCVFVANGSGHTSRLPALGPSDGALVPLTLPMLRDGPWCPDLAAANRYDADLLRIRRVRVTLRLQTGVTALRGLEAGEATDALFRMAGTSTDPYRTVPDREIHFDVSPGNMNLGR